MELITLRQREIMLAHGRQRLLEDNVWEPDLCRPVVKLFTPDAQATWLLTEIYPGTDESIAYGLCDLGLGFPELGDVDLVEISEVRGPLGLPVERDEHFYADKSLREYWREAQAAGRIVT